jgi:DNA helicase-2/ATP-dependent DNA helicase PcrA
MGISRSGTVSEESAASKLLKGLNTEQQRAVTTTEGPVLILAGAGSGKTKALTHRFAYLLEQRLARPEEILCVTFTNKAAREMQERVARLAGSGSISYPWLGTFHRICVKLLRRELDRSGIGYTGSFTIYDEGDSLVAVRRAMDALSFDQKRWSPKAVRSHISGAKNEMLSPEGYKRYAFSSFEVVVSQVYEQYQKMLKAANALDFDDILGVTISLFTEQPEVLTRYQERFRYLMVDEYQDTNKVQYELIRLLAAKHRNLFVIGDDWQSVYSWRGANFRTILDFQRDYSEAEVIKLEQNYRSTQTILDAAQAVIAMNQERSDKRLWTDGPTGVPVTVVRCLNERDEGEFIVREALALVRSHMADTESLSDCVILYRTNAQSRLLEETLVRLGVPYRMVGGVGFYERKEVKDLIAYLKVIANPQDTVSIERIINVPARGIGPKTAAPVILQPELLQNPAVLTAKVRPFAELLMRWVGLHADGASPESLLRSVVAQIGYEAHLRDGSVEGEARWENVLELFGAAARCETVENFLEDVALVQDTDQAEREGEGAITLMTLHAAKGLEFPVVFMTGLEEGVFPHSRSLEDPQGLEEERRLAYVGMTRAMRRLYLLYAFERRLYGLLQVNPPSRFLGEIPGHLVQELT